VQGEAWFWLGGSLLLAILGPNLAWLVRHRLRQDGHRAPQLPFPTLVQLARFVYYAGVPGSALLLGGDAVVERYLGIRAGQAGGWLAWVRALEWAVVLGGGAWLLLRIAWWAYRRALPGSAVESANRTSGWIHLREAAYHEIHWAFYRNAPLVALLRHTGDAYWGAWAGLALVAVEAALNPAWRDGMTDPHRAPQQLVRGALAVVSSALFLLAGNGGNLWLALALHWAISWSLEARLHFRPGRTPMRPAPPPAPQR
jgi:hypothetical protein